MNLPVVEVVAGKLKAGGAAAVEAGASPNDKLGAGAVVGLEVVEMNVVEGAPKPVANT